MLMLGSALKGIRSCCEMLNEGKAEIQRIKKGVEDAKAIVKDVSGFFGWLQGLFSPSDKQPSVAVQVEEPQKKAKKDEYEEFIPDEDAIVDQFIKHVGDFFKAQAYLVAYKEDLERKVFSSSYGDNNIGALELISIETKLVKCGRELVELMNEAPPQLGPLYSRYKSMYSMYSSFLLAVGFASTGFTAGSLDELLPENKFVSQPKKPETSLTMALASSTPFLILWISALPSLSISQQERMPLSALPSMSIAEIGSTLLTEG